MGKWSECNCFDIPGGLSSELSVAVTSGNVDYWCSPAGNLAGVFVFKAICLEFCIITAIRSPLWSSYDEYHVCEYAFLSQVTMLFLSCVRWKYLCLSSVEWSCLVMSGWYVYVHSVDVFELVEVDLCLQFGFLYVNAGWYMFGCVCHVLPVWWGPFLLCGFYLV